MGNLDYQEAKSILNGFPSKYKPRKRVTRPADSVKVANNTYLEREGAQRFSLRLHGYPIVTFTPHYLEFDTCGWPTMTTSERMQWTPVAVRPSRNGWALYPSVMRLCYTCKGTLVDEYGGGFTYSDGLVTPSDGGTPYHPAIWTPAPCAACEDGKVPGHDWDSGGHPFFNGMRTDAKGTRLLQRQPNKPANREPVKTISGFTGGPMPPPYGRRYHGVNVAPGRY